MKPVGIISVFFSFSEQIFQDPKEIYEKKIKDHLLGDFT